MLLVDQQCVSLLVFLDNVNNKFFGGHYVYLFLVMQKDWCCYGCVKYLDSEQWAPTSCCWCAMAPMAPLLSLSSLSSQHRPPEPEPSVSSVSGSDTTWDITFTSQSQQSALWPLWGKLQLCNRYNLVQRGVIINQFLFRFNLIFEFSKNL